MTLADLIAWHDALASDKYRLARELFERRDHKAACQLAADGDWHRAAAELLRRLAPEGARP